MRDPRPAAEQLTRRATAHAETVVAALLDAVDVGRIDVKRRTPEVARRSGPSNPTVGAVVAWESAVESELGRLDHICDLAAYAIEACRIAVAAGRPDPLFTTCRACHQLSCGCGAGWTITIRPDRARRWIIAVGHHLADACRQLEAAIDVGWRDGTEDQDLQAIRMHLSGIEHALHRQARRLAPRRHRQSPPRGAVCGTCGRVMPSADGRSECGTCRSRRSRSRQDEGNGDAA